MVVGVGTALIERLTISDLADGNRTTRVLRPRDDCLRFGCAEALCSIKIVNTSSI